MSKAIELNAEIFECLECSKVSVFRKGFSDGKLCPFCGGLTKPLGETYVGFDLARKKDKSITIGIDVDTTEVSKKFDELIAKAEKIRDIMSSIAR